MNDAGSPPASWLFSIASAPYGCFNGVVAVGLPFLLRLHGVPVDRIAGIAGLVQMPAIWYFLWAPMVDLGWQRRTWVILLSAATAVFAGTAIGLRGASALSMTILLVLASVCAQPISSAMGGLTAAVVADDHRGRIAGWSQAGILAGGVIAGGAVVWLSAQSHAATAWVVAALIAVPALAVLAIPEPKRAKLGTAEHLLRVAADVTEMFKRREIWLGVLFFITPVGAGALLNLFSAVPAEFHATSTTVIWLVVEAGVLTPAGAIVGGIICDRFNRWRMFAVAGLTSGVTAGILSLSPLTPVTYLIGAAGYAATTGFCFAAFMALALELVGPAETASGSRFTVFMCAVNIPVVYMLRLDGLGHSHFGIRGMVGVDAAADLVFGTILLLVANRVGASMTRRERALKFG